VLLYAPLFYASADLELKGEHRGRADGGHTARRGAEARQQLQGLGDRLGEVVLAAVTQNGYALQHASRKLKGDREVVLAAVAQNGRALRHASRELQRDREVVLTAVARDSSDTARQKSCGEMRRWLQKLS